MAARIQASAFQFGVTKNGEPVKMFVLRDADSGVEGRFIEIGASIQSLFVPDNKGKVEDVVLGYKTVEQYELHNSAYNGVIIGRCGGRIASSKFTLDGITYNVSKNHGEHNLHGGNVGMSFSLWKGRIVRDGAYPAVQFDFLSKQEDDGFPGDAYFRVTYTLNPESNLKCSLNLRIEVRVTKPCPITPVTHVYFNLNGERRAAHALIRNHLFQIHASRLADMVEFVPNGRLVDARDQFDFRQPRRARLVTSGSFGGYAHAYANADVPSTGTEGNQLKEVASAFVEANGRRLVVRTNQASTVFYTGHILEGFSGKLTPSYESYSGFAFECQNFWNAINLQHYPEFRDAIVRPGETFVGETQFEFSAVPEESA